MCFFFLPHIIYVTLSRIRYYINYHYLFSIHSGVFIYLNMGILELIYFIFSKFILILINFTVFSVHWSNSDRFYLHVYFIYILNFNYYNYMCWSWFLFHSWYIICLFSLEINFRENLFINDEEWKNCFFLRIYWYISN
jgi:hypothetical protein